VGHASLARPVVMVLQEVAVPVFRVTGFLGLQLQDYRFFSIYRGFLGLFKVLGFRFVTVLEFRVLGFRV
jgi:hypothetical protein